MSSGKPIIGMADGGVADLIREADCGLCVHAEDYTALCQAIVDDIIPNKETFSQKGSNGRAFYEKNFTTNRCINNLETIINTQQ
jgi:glycosyltransferase involved in cell wall biosynthesis